ncbi:MAG: nucleotidyltransferase family protein, partial [Burkholderiales bacterium]
MSGATSMGAETESRIGEFGIEKHALQQYRALCDNTPGLQRVWIFGSRARDDWRERSDIDLAVDAPSWGKDEFRQFADALPRLPVVYSVDAVHWQDKLTQPFAERIERDRKVFWEPRRHSAEVESIGATQLKPFQSTVLGQLARYITELKKHQAQAVAAEQALRAMEGMEDLRREASDFPKKTWSSLKAQGVLPATFAQQAHSSRFDGADRAIPNVCLKIPTGGGKTLLAAASVGQVFSSYLNRHTGLVLWIVP